MKIAVVDDDFTAQTLIADYLIDKNYEVVKAYEPNEISSVLSQLDVIIMDVMIKHDRTKGLKYIRDNAKQDNFSSKVLIIFVSNFGREPEEIQNLLIEVSRYINFKWLDKSFDSIFFDLLLNYVQKQSREK